MILLVVSQKTSSARIGKIGLISVAIRPKKLRVATSTEL